MVPAILALGALAVVGLTSPAGGAVVVADDPLMASTAPADPGSDIVGEDVPAPIAPDGWIDPTLPDLLLDEGEAVDGSRGDGSSSAPAPAGPAAKPAPDREEVRRSHADAAPPTSPGFVDDYTRLWRAIEAGTERVVVLKAELDLARTTMESASGDLAMTLRVRNRADFAYSDAADQLDVAIHDMYIAGSTELDVVLGVLGSDPDELLRTLDSVIYLESAGGSEDDDLRAAKHAALVAQSAAATTQIRLDDDRARLVDVAESLMRTRARLADNRAELDALIAAAAPQTVVGPSGCPKAVLDGTVPAGVSIRDLCRQAVASAVTPQAAFAIKWALVRLGAPYACDGVGRLADWRYDCSSFVSRAYAEGAGLSTAGSGWAPSTRMMVPWGGGSLDPHYLPIPGGSLQPGDLVLYDTCPAGEVCDYRHVVMYLGRATPDGPELMVHTNQCGGVAHIAPFTGTGAANFLGVRRVVPQGGEHVKAAKADRAQGTQKAAKAAR